MASVNLSKDTERQLDELSRLTGKSRDDLPDFEEIRRSMDRNLWER